MVSVLVTEVTPGAAECVRAMLSAMQDVEVLGYPRDGLEAVQMAVQLRPDVLLVPEKLAGMPGSEVCEFTAVAAPEVATVMMCEKDDAVALRRAMCHGARGVITPTTSSEEIGMLLTGVKEFAKHTSSDRLDRITDPSSMPQTISLVSSRDGVGKSTLATNLATGLAQRFPGQVVLVDLCGQFGSAELLLNVKPHGNIVDLAGFVHEMDQELVDTFLATHPSSLRVLVGGRKPDPAWIDALSVGFVSSLLALLRGKFRFVFCDLPAIVWPGSLYAVSRSQLCLVVASLWNVTEVHEVAALVETLIPDYMPPERLRLVVNRASNRDWFSEEDVQNATGHGVWHTVPNDTTNVFAAANEGAPVVITKPTAPFAKGVLALGDKIVKECQAAA